MRSVPSSATHGQQGEDLRRRVLGKERQRREHDGGHRRIDEGNAFQLRRMGTRIGTESGQQPMAGNPRPLPEVNGDGVGFHQRDELQRDEQDRQCAQHQELESIAVEPDAIAQRSLAPTHRGR
jgi:hypothetical protein